MFNKTNKHITKAVQWSTKHQSHLALVVAVIACSLSASAYQESLQSLLWPQKNEIIVRSSSSSSRATAKSADGAGSSARRRVPYRITRKVFRSAALSSARRTILHASSSARSFSSASSLYMPVKTPAGQFPAFVKAVYPVSAVPNWGAMHKAAEWNRSYAELTRDDLVPVPAYDMQKLLTPMKTLIRDKEEEEITRKLFYSTKYFGKYDLDAAEFTAAHPGVDLKLALGTPLGAIAGGRVNAIRNTKALGIHVVIEHRLPEGTFYSVYGHMESVTVQAGEDVVPGQMIGTVGMTGNTSGPHLHLQIDRGMPAESEHIPYLPNSGPTPAEAENYVVHPIRFIEKY